MPPADLSPEAQRVVDTFTQTRWPGRRPRACYRALPPTERLHYEPLDWSNYRSLLDLFGSDNNPFVMPVYRNKGELDEYVAYQLMLGRYSGKRGACDWLLRLANGLYVGVLHLYNVSFELIDGRRDACYCGYAIAEPHRRQGYAKEALTHLLALLPPMFQLYEACAEPLRANALSRQLLEHVGFSFQRNIRNDWGPAALYYKRLMDVIPRLSASDLEPLR